MMFGGCGQKVMLRDRHSSAAWVEGCWSVATARGTSEMVWRESMCASIKKNVYDHRNLSMLLRLFVLQL